MTFGEKVANEAREWVGTPFVWDQSRKGVGCDCRGLIAGVARELGRPEAETLYANLRGYRSDRPVPSGLLVEGMEATFNRAKKIRPGTILLLKLKTTLRPSHLAIATFDGKAVHARASGLEKVRETDLNLLYHFYPLHSVWGWRRCR